MYLPGLISCIALCFSKSLATASINLFLLLTSSNVSPLLWNCFNFLNVLCSCVFCAFCVSWLVFLLLLSSFLFSFLTCCLFCLICFTFVMFFLPCFDLSLVLKFCSSFWDCTLALNIFLACLDCSLFLCLISPPCLGVSFKLGLDSLLSWFSCNVVLKSCPSCECCLLPCKCFPSCLCCSLICKIFPSCLCCLLCFKSFLVCLGCLGSPFIVKTQTKRSITKYLTKPISISYSWKLVVVSKVNHDMLIKFIYNVMRKCTLPTQYYTNIWCVYSKVPSHLVEKVLLGVARRFFWASSVYLRKTVLVLYSSFTEFINSSSFLWEVRHFE